MFSNRLEFEQQLDTARQAAATKRWQRAILYQRRAIQTLRQLIASSTVDHQEGLSRLGIELYNLGFYHAEVKNWRQSVTALTETVAIEAQLNAPDLAQSQKELAQARLALMQMAIEQAETAVATHKFIQATHHQELAVHTLRDMLVAHDHPQIQAELSVQLYNLAGYYGHLGRHHDAVEALEEVVTIDRLLALPDLESDLEVLQEARLGASLVDSKIGQTVLNELQEMSPSQLAEFSQEIERFIVQLNTLPTTQQQQFAKLIEIFSQKVASMDEHTQLELGRYAADFALQHSFFSHEDRLQLEQKLFDLAQTTADFAHLSPPEQLLRLQEIRVDYLVHEIKEGVWAWQDGDISTEETAEMIQTLQELAPSIATDNSFGPYQQDLAQYILAIAAYIDGVPNPPIPPSFKEDFIQLTITESHHS